MDAHFPLDLAGQPSRSRKNCFSQPTSLLNDRYRILKSLGQGGFGRTFLAVDEWQPPLHCVVKQFLPGRSISDHSIYQQKIQTLFCEEAQRLAELGEHPQIPRLLATFEQGGDRFIVQEWIDGWTLEQEMAGAVPFSEAEVRKVLQALLPILHHLHDREIIHRDIKPANIIRRRTALGNETSWDLVLVDFGAAKQITHIRPVESGTMIGSVEYAAPEQIKGQAVFASDLYSLGVTCLYLLTQISPFDLYDIVEDDWKWQAYLPQPISSDLQAILCKLLQPAVRRRYQSAAEVLIDLQAASGLKVNSQVDNALAPVDISEAKDNAAIIKPLDSETNPAAGLKLAASAAQVTRFVSETAVSRPQTSAEFYLESGMAVVDAGKPAFFFTPRSTAAATTPPVPEALLFADDIAALKALPLVQRVLIVGIGTAIGSVAMACLVLCLGIIIFAISTPQPSSATPFKHDQTILKSL